MERQAQELSDTWRLGELASEREGLQRESLGRQTGPSIESDLTA